MGRMILNGTVYGAGAKVEANPSEIATDTLQTVDIDGVIYDIQGGGGGSNLILGAAMYSTDEKQVGVWIDGKPIYQKTISCGALPNNTDKRIQHGIQNVDYFVGVFGIAESPNINSVPIIFPNSGGGGIATIILEKSSDIIIRCNSDRSTYTKTFITIQYTKTTDAAGSGGYQAWGFSPIIYSDVEREIGVYVDNKPLYQRTVVFTGAFYGNMTIGVNPVVNAETYANITISARSDGTWRSLGFAHSDQGNNASIFISDSNNFQLRTGIDVTSAQAYDKIIITMQYTKTTDVAGSGEYNTLGIPNVHYDGNERIVGTWFGETLYEKTFIWTLAQTIQDTTITIDTFEYNQNIKNYSGMATESGVNYLFPYVANNAAYGSFIFRANGNIEFIVHGTSFAQGSEIRLTVQYTKTTD